MRALRLEEIGRLELVEVERPAFGDDEMLVKTGAALICTSDLNDIRENPFGITLPVVMGHEGAGVVAEVGSVVTGFAVGDHIAAHPVHPCGRCRSCARGMGHLCLSMGHFALDMPGTFAEYYVVRQDRARVVSQQSDLATVALTEPICVCLEALSRARLNAGDRLLIMGDGPFGVLMARLAGQLGLSRLVIAGHHGFRLGLAGDAVRVNTTGMADPVAALRGAAEDAGYDAVILAVGSSTAVTQGLELLAPRGRLVVFSAVLGATPIDLFPLHIRELEIVGACNDLDMLDDAVRLLADGNLRLGELVTHRFPIERYREAFEVAAGRHASAMKVALMF
jgi:threonine dehydrogenase-like Zn-dependent dehydrogenase